MKRAVFLDRDGVIIQDSPNYVTSWDQVKLLEGAANGIRLLNTAKIPVIVVTNQAAIAHGRITEAELAQINNRMEQLLEEEGAQLTKIYFCPFHPEARILKYKKASPLRKPEPGMILLAARELSIDLSVSFMVGDKDIDILAGQKAGCRTVLIRPTPLSPPLSVTPDFTADTLQQAAEWICSSLWA